MKLAIIGGGFTGLAAAKKALEAGWEVELLEQSQRLGGLAGSVPLEGTQLEIFYHHIFLSDHYIRELIRELGLEGQLRWLDSKMGFFTGGRVFEFGTPVSLLRFEPLGWLDKLRFGLSVLKLQRLDDWQALETVTAKEWFVQNAGEHVYRTCWEPLLKAKFGRRHDEISMAWMWGKIRLRGSTRSKSKVKEQLGYMHGSFAVVGDKLVERVEALGARIVTGAQVSAVRHHLGQTVVAVNGEDRTYDRVLLTVPLPVVSRLLQELPDEYRTKIEAIEYTGVICSILKLKRSFSDIYWMNIGDRTMPFGGLIEHTNLYRDPDYNNKHILYISNYIYTDEALYRASDAELLAAYLPHLQTINPEFTLDWIEEFKAFRAPYAQPVIPLSYSQTKPDFKTPIPGVFIANMAHIYPEDRGMNYAIRTGYEVVAAMLGNRQEASASGMTAPIGQWAVASNKASAPRRIATRF